VVRVIPIIHVEDIDSALDFYTRVLGCEIDFVGRDDEGVAFHSGVNFRGAPLMIGARKNLDEDERDLPPGGLIVQFDLDAEIDGLYEQVNAHEVDVTRPIANRYWGQRSFQIHGPFGYHLSFAMNIDSEVALSAG